MELLAKPWNGLIIAALESGPARFSDLQERLGTIADRILSERLKELQAAGLLVRHVFPGPPVRVEYELTSAGHGFRQVYDAIGRWGEMMTKVPKRAAPKRESATKEAAPTRERGVRAAKEAAPKRERATKEPARKQ